MTEPTDEMCLKLIESFAKDAENSPPGTCPTPQEQLERARRALRAALGESLNPKPRHGFTYKHFGCPTCGTVRTLPAEQGELPWCLHHDGLYSWRAPHSSDSDWSLMVPVEVFTL